MDSDKNYKKQKEAARFSRIALATNHPSPGAIISSLGERTGSLISPWLDSKPCRRLKSPQNPHNLQLGGLVFKQALRLNYSHFLTSSESPCALSPAGSIALGFASGFPELMVLR